MFMIMMLSLLLKKVSWYIIVTWMIMNDYDYIYGTKKEVKVLRWYMLLTIIIFDRFMFEL